MFLNLTTKITYKSIILDFYLSTCDLVRNTNYNYKKKNMGYKIISNNFFIDGKLRPYNYSYGFENLKETIGLG